MSAVCIGKALSKIHPIDIPQHTRRVPALKPHLRKMTKCKSSKRCRRSLEDNAHLSLYPAKEEMRKEHILHFLGDLFRKADSDDSGQISRDEFDMMLRSPELVKKLMKYSKMEPKDLEELFEWIDHDGSGTINLTEFMDGFKWINEPLRAKSLVKVFQRLGDDIRSLRASVVGTIERKFEEVNCLLAEPLRKVHAICEQMQTLDSTFGEFAQEVKKPMDVPTQQELQAAEERLSKKLKRVCDRLAQVERMAGR